MAIRFDHPATAGMVGAYAAGMARGDARRRKEQLAALQQMYDKRFQLGMNQLRYGQEQQLAQDRWNQQKQWQDERDEREFGQKQQMANAEAYARGEPLPFPGLGQGQQTGTMQGRILPGGRQAFEGPDSTIDPNAPFDPFAAAGHAPALRDPFAEAGYTPSLGGGSYRDDFYRTPGSTPSSGATQTRPGYDAAGNYVGRTQAQQREDERKRQEQAAANAKIRAGIGITHEYPPEIQAKIDKARSDLVKAATDDTMTEKNKAELKARFLAKIKELEDVGTSLATPKQKPDSPHTVTTPGGTEWVRQPDGKWVQARPAPPPKGQMTDAQKAQSEAKAKEREEKRQTERAKYQIKQEDAFKQLEPDLRDRITKEVTKGWTMKGKWLGFGSRPMTAEEIEADPEFQAEIDKRMEAERKARVDDAVEKAYPTAKPEPKTEPAPGPQQPPAAQQQPPDASAPPDTYNNPNDPTPWLPDWAKPSDLYGPESALSVPIDANTRPLQPGPQQQQQAPYGPQQPGPNGQQQPLPASPPTQAGTSGPTPPNRLNRERYRIKLELEYAAAEDGLRQQIIEKAGAEASKAEINRLMEEERRKRVDVPLEQFDNWEKSQGAATAQQPAPAQQPTVPAGMTRLIEAARAGNTKAQQALEQRGIRWQQ